MFPDDVTRTMKRKFVTQTKLDYFCKAMLLLDKTKHAIYPYKLNLSQVTVCNEG